MLMLNLFPEVMRMYYDFFCNEKMLLDHYEDYHMGNRTLNRLLAQSGMPPD